MKCTGDPLHSRALAHSRAPLFTQPCPHCSHSRAPGEQWARLCVFTLQGWVQAARLCRGSPVNGVLVFRTNDDPDQCCLMASMDHKGWTRCFYQEQIWHLFLGLLLLGRATLIGTISYVSVKLVTIGSGNDLLPVWYHIIIGTKADILSIRYPGTNFIEHCIKIH